MMFMVQMRVQTPEMAVCSPAYTYLLYVSLVFTIYYTGSLVISANLEISRITFYKLHDSFGLNDGNSSFASFFFFFFGK